MPGIFYIDCWPYADPQMIITDPDAALQILIKNPYPKHEQVEKFLRPFTGPDSIAASNGERWKTNHRILGSGFTPAQVKHMMSSIADNVLIFHGTLQRLARDGKAFSMEEETAKVVFDVIGTIVFGFSLEAQRNGSPLLDDLRASIDPAAAALDAPAWKPWLGRPSRRRLAALQKRIQDRLVGEMRARLKALSLEKEAPPSRRARSILDRIILDHIGSEPEARDLDENFTTMVVTK